MDISVRSIQDEDVEEFRRVLVGNFGEDLADDELAVERFRDLFENSRTFAAFEGDQIVGTAGAFSKRVAVPGGVLPMAGTTIVSVRPTHRRRGILRSMMRAHLDEARERGDPLVALWASEASIYGRFGYGCAADMMEIEFDARSVGLRADEPTEHVRIVELEEARRLVPPLYEEHWPTHPGMLDRSDAWWSHRRFHDPDHFRDGASSRRHAVVFEGDRPVGYVAYRQKTDWGGGIANGELRISELIGLNPEARRALWRMVANVDLFPKVTWWNAPTDLALPWEVSNPRAIARKIHDSLWVRVHDVPAALEGRTYGRDGSIGLHVVDPFCPWAEGTYRLEVDETKSVCVPTDDHPDVTLTAPALGALFMGGRRATTLERAGLIDGDHEDVMRLDAMFSNDVAPWCPEIF